MAGISPRPAATLGARAAAAVLAASSVVHVMLVGDHHREVWWLGAAFLVDGAVLMISAALLWRRESANVWRLSGVICCATAVAYCLSRLVGLPGSHREAWDTLGLTTTSAQILVLCSSVRFVAWRSIGRRIVPAALAATVLVSAAYAAAPPRALDPFDPLNPVTERFLRDMVRHGHMTEAEFARYAGAAR